MFLKNEIFEEMQCFILYFDSSEDVILGGSQGNFLVFKCAAALLTLGTSWVYLFIQQQSHKVALFYSTLVYDTPMKYKNS